MDNRQRGGATKVRRLIGNGDGNFSNDGLGDGRDGLWESMNPEVLALIFVLIPTQELIRIVPLVCKSWREAVAGPYCWSNIDIIDWCRRCNKIDRINIVVRRLIRRSKGTCRRFSGYRVGDPAFSAVVSCSKNLKVLRVPMSLASDKMVKKHVQSLKLLTVLDISNCIKITCDGLEALGKTCTFLVCLRRNLQPLEADAARKVIDEGEAMIIAETMPRLQSLELAFGRFTDLGLSAILTKCKNLTLLDIQGCMNVRLDGDLEDKCTRIMKFIDPWFHDHYGLEGSSDSDGDGFADSESDDSVV